MKITTQHDFFTFTFVLSTVYWWHTSKFQLLWTIHDFHKWRTARAEWWLKHQIKARKASSVSNMAATPPTSTNVAVLSENDIPGASLCGRKPSELKNEELKFWLRCRGDPAKGLKTKAELVKRWECLPRAPFLFVYICQLLTCRGYSIVYDHTPLSFRVEQYIEKGRDKNVVDPDPSGLYTKRKQ